jgi:hypothetical protein
VDTGRPALKPYSTSQLDRDGLRISACGTEAEVSAPMPDVRYEAQSGLQLRSAHMSAFDPKRKFLRGLANGSGPLAARNVTLPFVEFDTRRRSPCLKGLGATSPPGAVLHNEEAAMITLTLNGNEVRHNGDPSIAGSARAALQVTSIGTATTARRPLTEFDDYGDELIGCIECKLQRRVNFEITQQAALWTWRGRRGWLWPWRCSRR